MSNDEVTIGDLERGPSAKFPELGSRYHGIVQWSRRVPQTDFDTGEILTWNDGSQRMQTLIGLDLGSGDSTTLYARGGKFIAEEGQGESMEVAIVRAVRAAGDDRIRKGARLTVTHSGLSKPAKKGMNAAKLFTVEYAPPAAEVSVGDLFSDAES